MFDIMEQSPFFPLQRSISVSDSHLGHNKVSPAKEQHDLQEGIALSRSDSLADLGQNTVSLVKEKHGLSGRRENLAPKRTLHPRNDH